MVRCERYALSLRLEDEMPIESAAARALFLSRMLSLTRAGHWLQMSLPRVNKS